MQIQKFDKGDVVEFTGNRKQYLIEDFVYDFCSHKWLYNIQLEHVWGGETTHIQSWVNDDRLDAIV